MYLVFSIIFYIVSIALAAWDRTFSFRWITFFLWITGCLLPAAYVVKKKNILESATAFVKQQKRERIVFFGLCILTCILGFSLLKEYPFVAIYDQVRDGGMNAAEIVHGTFINIFGYGRYASHGATIPTVTSFFYLLFGNSVYTFRIPAALLGVIDTLLLYVLVRKITNKQKALFSALTLTTLPLHLYFARTEVVVMWSEFFTLIDLLLFSSWMKEKTVMWYVLLGISLGFGSGFHTSARTVSLGIGIFTIILALYDFFKTKKYINLLGILLLIVFYFVGFGPRILFTTPDIFFQTRSFAAHQGAFSVQKLLANYWKSLLVYVNQPTYSTHYPDFKPLLTPLLSVFFIAGLIFSLFSKNLCIYILILLTFALPFTNSAVTEAVNSDNRLLPLLIMAAIFTGIGIGEAGILIKRYAKQTGYIVFSGILIMYLLLQAFYFFWNEPANKFYGVSDYLSMHTVYALQSNEQYQKLSRFCFFVSPTTYQYYNLLHVQEQYQYFVPGKTITVISQPSVPDNQIFISASCNFTQIQQRSLPVVFCNPHEKFVCPQNSLIVIFIEDTGKASAAPASLPVNESLTIPPQPAFIP